jgi:hypothetical protein
MDTGDTWTLPTLGYVDVASTKSCSRDFARTNRPRLSISFPGLLGGRGVDRFPPLKHGLRHAAHRCGNEAAVLRNIATCREGREAGTL